MRLHIRGSIGLIAQTLIQMRGQGVAFLLISSNGTIWCSKRLLVVLAPLAQDHSFSTNYEIIIRQRDYELVKLMALVEIHE